MRPDLRNVITVSEAGEGHGPRVIVRHRAFPETQADGQSPLEALLALQSVLKRSAAWTTDAWHTADLARAIFDVESIHWLLNGPEQGMISGGHSSKLIKKYDTIYYLTDWPDEDISVSANRDNDRPGLIETQDDTVPPRTVLIYSVGRRRAARRRRRNGKEPGPDRRELSRLDRRQCDRRQLNRVSLIADVPPTSGSLGGFGMEPADLPTSPVA
jgi:hypothetical protein